MKTKTKGILLSFASVLIMGLSPVINMFSLLSINPFVASFYSSLFSTVFCIISIILAKKKVILIKDIKLYFLGITNSIGVACQYFSLYYLGPIAFGLVGRFYIIFSIFLAVIILKERIKPLSYFPIMLCVLGSFLVINTNATSSNTIGIMLGLSYTFLFALTNLLAKKLVDKLDSSIILFYNQLVSTILIGAYLLLVHQDWSLFNVGSGIYFLVISAFCSGFLGIILFYESIKYIKFSTANLIRSLNPVTVFIYSFAFFPVEITSKFIIGSILIIISVICLNILHE